MGASYGDWQYGAKTHSVLYSGREYSIDRDDPDYLGWAHRLFLWWDMALEESTPVLETSQWYLFGYGFATDKTLRQAIIWSDEQREKIILPDKYNTYAGKSWMITESHSACWFDIETFEYGEVTFDSIDAGAPTLWNENGVNIPAGEVVYTGIRQTDGKPVVCIIRIDTGRATVSVLEDNRPIVALVPLD